VDHGDEKKKKKKSERGPNYETERSHDHRSRSNKRRKRKTKPLHPKKKREDEKWTAFRDGKIKGRHYREPKWERKGKDRGQDSEVQSQEKGEQAKIAGETVEKRGRTVLNVASKKRRYE